MIARRIAGATHALGPPVTMTSEECGRLWVKASQEGQHVVCESAWEPTLEELAALNAGGSLILRVMGWQPAVALYVSPASEPEST